MSFPDALAIQPLVKPPKATIQPPGSKSITNRALVLAALTARGHACALQGASRCEDTEVMIDCLRALGFRVLTEWPECLVFVSSDPEAPTIPASAADLDVAGSGTTMRFLTAMVALGHGRYRLDGNVRMRERPVEHLLEGLRQLGVKAYSENGNRCPPVVVEADGLREGTARLNGKISSQYVSAILMAATRAEGRVRVQVEAPRVSEPYVRMTLRMIKQFGFAVREEGPDDIEIFGRGEYRPILKKAAPFPEKYVRPHHIPLRDYQIEPDASSASYFWAAAAILEGKVTVPNLNQKSLQGDVQFLDVLEDMGCEVSYGSDAITLCGGPLRGIDVAMNDISDTVMTLAAVACFALGPTTIRNVEHVRHKESDRLAAVAAELRRIGATVDEFADGLTITPGPLHGAEIETYNDHRIAMAMALVGLKVPGIVIKNPGCVAKTYPGFFEDLEKLR
ncbi:MAG: 3-phosphoshikimate 1-carboxyvinyltransferase [Planctomycetes bacterium]|nr:3-phosphoshikimate 1-carboxyvinyltransferase [Planctomycetota bacterium]